MTLPPELDVLSTDPTRASVAAELVSRHELGAVLAALHTGGLTPLIFKGAALAFTHYPFPAARPHLDVDMLVPSAQATPAGQILERLGYRRPLRIAGELIRSQVPYVRLDPLGVFHTIDLHWKVSLPQVFAHLFPFVELEAASVPLPALGPAARAVGNVHALAIACVHRVAHHPGEDRLIWLYDIHLLASALDAQEAAAFVDVAARGRIAHVCAHGLALARQRFGTRCPDGLVEALDRLRQRDPKEPSRAYLAGRMRQVDILWSDLKALPSWRARLRLVGEHLFPPASYMQQAYGVSGPALLPMLYAWRALAGVGEWFRRNR